MGKKRWLRGSSFRSIRLRSCEMAAMSRLCAGRIQTGFLGCKEE